MSGSPQPASIAAPRAVLAVPLHNSAEHLAQALDSLLEQEEPRIGVALVDDHSVDDTPEIARRYAESDDRVVFSRNERRLGLAGNWQAALDLALRTWPEAPYCAWASDHDLWDPGWLARLAELLDRDPEVVLAYPAYRQLNKRGKIVAGHRRPRYDSRGLAAHERLRAACLELAAGYAIYGLFRTSAMRRVRGFRRVLLPDRLFVRALALHGDVVQLEDALFFRRRLEGYSPERQRRALFPDGPPLHAYLPSPLVHGAVIAWDLSVRGRGRPAIGRLHGVSLAARYVWYTTPNALRRARKVMGARRDRAMAGRAGVAVARLRRSR